MKGRAVVDINLYNRCLKIAKKAHKGQVRRESDDPYIVHPVRVAEMVGDELKYAALLHDVLEDSNFTAKDLLEQGVPKDVVNTVVVMTKDYEATYSGYIDAIASDAAATKIKVADMVDNLSGAPTPCQKKKYYKALNRLIFNE